MNCPPRPCREDGQQFELLTREAYHLSAPGGCRARKLGTLRNREIGKELGISIETLKTHIERLYKRLNVTTRTDAVAKALRAGIIEYTEAAGLLHRCWSDHQSGSLDCARGAGGVRGVVFEMDGTLVDSLGVVVDRYRRAIVEFEGPDRSPDQIFASFSIGPARAMLSELIGRPVGDIAVVRYESLLANRCDEIRPYQGIRDAVARLGRSLPFAVFTAADTHPQRTSSSEPQG